MPRYAPTADEMSRELSKRGSRAPGRRGQRQLSESLITEARAHLGYRALPNMNSTYGTATGSPYRVWNGSFITAIAGASAIEVRASRYGAPISTVSTVSALQAFITGHRIFRVPQVGDLVFFARASDGDLGQPAIGLVTDVSRWKAERRVTAIEAQTDSEQSHLPRVSKEANGVFERTRFATEIMAFARPLYAHRTETVPEPAEATNTETLPWVKVRQFAYGRQHKSVELVQMALGDTVALTEANRGYYDAATRQAYALWQRKSGLVGNEVTGMPDTETLTLLGKTSKLFTVRD